MSVLTDKDAGKQPLLLCDIVFPDGAALHLSTHEVTWGGNSYSARLDDQVIPQIAARSEQGVDRIPSVQVAIHDSDKVMLSTYGFASGRGFRGSNLTLTLVFADIEAGTFSSDYWMPFQGIVESSDYQRKGRADILLLSANASHNNARVYLPAFIAQSRCSNIFPTGPDSASQAAARLRAATDMSDQSWGCGYCLASATDAETGSSAITGNTGAANLTMPDGTPLTDSAGVFVACDYTNTRCIQIMGNPSPASGYGPLDQDASGRQSGRFTGITWAPTRMYRSESYVSGKWTDIVNPGPDIAWGKPFPMVRGVQWVKPVVLNVFGAADSTRFEVALCQDKVSTDAIVVYDGITQVNVNGFLVPENGSSPDNKLFRWNWSSNGSRRGSTTGDIPYSHAGDPHGSVAVIEIVVYSQVAQAGSVPNVQVLMQGSQVKIPTTANAADQHLWALSNSTNAAFLWLDTMIWGNYRYDEIDLQTVIDAAPYCDAQINYIDATGATTNVNADGSPHRRFDCMYSLETKRSLSDASKAMARCFNAQFPRNMQTGKIQLLIRKTLSDQQPAPVSGSNYNTAVSSVSADGSSKNGYLAYLFDETNILRAGPDDPPFLRVYTDSNSSTPNNIRFGFQDRNNSYASDTISVVDSAAISRSGGSNGDQEITDSWDVMGVSDFDTGLRISNTALAEKLRGNATGEPSGTEYVDIPADFRCVHLTIGSIIGVSWQAYAWTMRQFRVIGVKPARDWESCTITAAGHRDEWYTDAFGQHGPSVTTQPGLGRLPYAWQPFGEQPIAGDSLMGAPVGFAARSWWSFGVSPLYDTAADGSARASLSILGCPPVNGFSQTLQPPVMGIRGVAAGSGGSILAARGIYIAIAALDSAGLESKLSTFALCVTPAGADTCTITTPLIQWPAGTSSYIAYAGSDQSNMSAQAVGSGTPPTITLTALNFETFGPPDQSAVALHFQAKRCGAAGSPPKSYGHSGVWGDELYSVAANTLHFNPPAGSFGANQFAGYDLVLLALPQGNTGTVPLASFRISANTTGGDFTVTPDPVAAGILAGSVFACMSVPSGSSTATSIVDPNYQNAYNGGAGLTAGAEVGNVVRVLIGSGQYAERTITANTQTSISWADPLPSVPDSSTRYIIETPTWDYDVSAPINASHPAPSPVPSVGSIPVDNYAGQTLFVRVHVQDVNEYDSIQSWAPWRIVYVWGSQGTVVTVS